MTTYTITDAQRKQLMAALEPHKSTALRWVTEEDAALGLLHSLQPNTQEPAASIDLSTNSGFINWRESPHDFTDGTELYTHPAPQQPAKTNWSELVQWWESGGEQWDVLQNIVTRMVNTAAPQAKPLTTEEVEQILAQHNYELHGDRARYIVRMTEQAHGVKP